MPADGQDRPWHRGETDCMRAKAADGGEIAGEVCVLAGGRSRRMGRDKSRLQLGGETLLSHVVAGARGLGWPLRVIRRDRIRSCGPLSGVHCALDSTQSDRVLFLSCDMPFVSSRLLHELILAGGSCAQAVFTRTSAGWGFPFLLCGVQAPWVRCQVEEGRRSLQEFADCLKANAFAVMPDDAWQLFNVNTPEDWEVARQIWHVKHG